MAMKIRIAFILHKMKNFYRRKFYPFTVPDSSVTASVKTFMNASSFIFHISVLSCQVCFASKDSIHAGHHQGQLTTMCWIT